MKEINIVGISGKKQSGKDTVGKIIQYLSFEGSIPYSLTEALQNPNECDWMFGSANMQWKKKQFAAKLKEIVALLIGCKVEQLEDETFKNTLLGEEWNRWRIRINYETFNDGVPGSYVINKIYLTKEEAEKVDTLRYEPELCEFIGADIFCEQLTPRLILQVIGTEGLRDLIHPNVHVNALFSDYKPLGKMTFNPGNYMGKCRKCGVTMWNVQKLQPWCEDCVNLQEDEFPKWIIPDTRFPNEAEAIKKRDGIVIRVENPRVNHGDNHPSETSLDTYEFNYTIVNDGTIEELIEKVKLMMIAFKLL